MLRQLTLALGKQAPRAYKAPGRFVMLQRYSTAQAQAVVMDASTETTQEPVLPTQFAEIDALHPVTQKALDKVFKYKTMSPVQAAVLAKLPTDKDMFVKAKTGTGKTLAFLLAALQSVDMQSKFSEGTSILIISPTRELAQQIVVEARKLVKLSPFKVHCLVGGESKHKQIQALQRGRCDIVVATPGRLNDMLQSVPHLRRACESLKVLVLDEADQLLDMGFKQELRSILGKLDAADRQTLLFSATLSDSIKHDLGRVALSPDYDLIDTVGDQDVQTHLHIKQSAMVLPYDQDYLAHVQHILAKYPAAQQGKVIVFLPTTKQTMLYAKMFQSLLPHRTVHEIHSLKNQGARTRISRNFRQSKNDILFTTDVSARGVDYPDVSLVLQIGVPSSREQYIHRIGRTGRAGREGEGILIMSPWEKSFTTTEAHDIPIATLQPAENPEPIKQEALDRLLANMDSQAIREVYTAYLGFYVTRFPQLGERRMEVMTAAKGLLSSFGIEEVPHLSDSFKNQLGLSDRAPRQRSNSSSFSRSRSSDRYDRFDRRSERPRFNDRRDGPSSSRRRRDDNNNNDNDDFFGRPARRFNDRNNDRRFNDRRDGDSDYDRPARRNSRFNDRNNDRAPPRRTRRFEPSEENSFDRAMRRDNRSNNDDNAPRRRNRSASF
ncbi:P-loop containing nucleoside triphosphate hydrolase protein [Gongronella butleri]|nr:P-loop containing nucleoside triphosphate hydrolase protein [Gongronella butleri]